VTTVSGVGGDAAHSGGLGGVGVALGTVGNVGQIPGGGGSGGYSTNALPTSTGYRAGGAGARGEVRITYTIAGGATGIVHVTANRSVGSLSLVVDEAELAASNLPTKFVATVGTLGPNGFITPSTKTEFAGHKDGATTIAIDGFLPGSTDFGNFEQQVLIVRPSTHTANAVAKWIENATGTGTPEPWFVDNMAVDTLTADSLTINRVTLLDGVTNPAYRYTLVSDDFSGKGRQITFAHGLAFTPRVRARYSAAASPDLFNPLPESIAPGAYGDPPGLTVNIQAVDATNITVGIAIQDGVGLSTMLYRLNLLFQFYCDRFPGT
jgi:hypothetical protein